jgi:hypothetical protein
MGQAQGPPGGARKTNERFDQALEAWRAVREPHERSVESHHQRMEADVARLERAQQARAEFLAQDPSALERVAQLGLAVKGARESRAPTLLAPSTTERQAYPQHPDDLGRDRGYGTDL